jgi:hypothetical protein
MINKYGALDGMRIGKVNQVTTRNPAQLSLCPTHDLISFSKNAKGALKLPV